MIVNYLIAIFLFVQCGLCVAKTEFDKFIDFCTSIASTYEPNYAKLTERQTVATYAENGKLFSEYGNFCEGDFVSRNGTDVHLVTNMSEDGYIADFVCVIEPSDGWAKIGEVESNLCSRYSNVNYTPPNETR